MPKPSNSSPILLWSCFKDFNCNSWCICCISMSLQCLTYWLEYFLNTDILGPMSSWWSHLSLSPSVNALSQKPFWQWIVLMTCMLPGYLFFIFWIRWLGYLEFLNVKLWEDLTVYHSFTGLFAHSFFHSYTYSTTIYEVQIICESCWTRLGVECKVRPSLVEIKVYWRTWTMSMSYQ